MAADQLSESYLLERLLELFQSCFGVAAHNLVGETPIREKISVSDVEWLKLADQINQAPWARELGLYIAPVQMAEAKTLVQIAEHLLTNRGDKSFSSKRVLRGGSKRTVSLKVGSKEQTSTQYRVWYGTNRTLNAPGDITAGFSSDRDSTTHFGTCDVSVPKSHKIGSIGSSLFMRLISMQDDRLKILSVDSTSEQAFWQAMSERLAGSADDRRQAIVFIHGYNVSFEEAAIRAAQIGFDLSVSGVMAFFSWPSRGSLSGYSADEASIEASEGAIANFLVRFAEQSGAERIHLIAHSMGNRGLLRAINRVVALASVSTRKLFDQIVLAAPDVDSDVFKELCNAYSRVAKRATLYVSQKDRAVETSEWLHHFPRVGFAPPIFIAPGIDTINVTGVDVSLLGHGYVSEARNILHDMYNLLMHDADPDRRMGLRRIVRGDDVYWEIGR